MAIIKRAVRDLSKGPSADKTSSLKYIFSDEFRNNFVAKLSSEEKMEDVSFHDTIDLILEEFVKVIEDNLDVDSILSVARNI